MCRGAGVTEVVVGCLRVVSCVLFAESPRVVRSCIGGKWAVVGDVRTIVAGFGEFVVGVDDVVVLLGGGVEVRVVDVVGVDDVVVVVGVVDVEVGVDVDGGFILAVDMVVVTELTVGVSAGIG